MTEKLNAIYARIEPWQKFLAVVFGLVGAIYCGISFVQSTAKNAVLDERFLGTLASRVRPSLIFNTHDSIEADFGAEEYIADISVTPNPKFYGFDVLIRAKRHLAYPPLITAIDVNLFQS